MTKTPEITGAPPGTPNCWPDEAELRTELSQRVLEMVRAHGYRQASSPLYEPFDLYTRLYGDAIRNRLLTFTTDHEYALRPDLTGGLCRMVATELGPTGTLATPLRLAAFGQAFRHERIRPLRLREFHQFGLERIGDTKDDIQGGDLEIISLARLALHTCGLPGGLLRIGHATLRNTILEGLKLNSTAQQRIDHLLDQLSRLRAWFNPPRTGIDQPLDTTQPRYRDPREHPDATHVIHEACRQLQRMFPKLDTTSQTPDTLVATLEELLHHEAQTANLSKVVQDALHGLTWGAASIAELIDTTSPLLDDAETSLHEALGHLDNCQADLEPLVLRFSLGMVRGLGYYTGITFEIDAPILGPDVCQLVGGGRYDSVLSDLGGPSLSAAGFAIGVERLIAALRAVNGPQALRANFTPPEPVLLCFSTEHDDQVLIADLADELKQQGASVAIHPTPLPLDLPEQAFINSIDALPGRPYRFIILARNGHLDLAQLDEGQPHPTDMRTLLMMFTR